VQLLYAAAGTLRTLASSNDRYRGLAWRKDAFDLAVLRTRADTGFRDTAHVALAWVGVHAGAPTTLSLAPDQVPAGYRVSETLAPSWVRTGGIVLLGLRQREPQAPADTAKADTTKVKVSDVQIWRARDLRILPMQKSLEQADLRRTVLAAWHPAGGRMVQVSRDPFGTTQVLEGGRFAMESSAARYPFGYMYGRPSVDVALIDLGSGERRQVLDSVRFALGPSATGRYILSYRQGKYSVFDVTTGRHTALTAPGADFVDRDYDSPTDEPPSRGVAGWTKDDQAVLVYDKYDIWRVRADGSGAGGPPRGQGDVRTADRAMAGPGRGTGARAAQGGRARPGHASFPRG
jgi:hypothetical protein